jgi:hypothetical protein
VARASRQASHSSRGESDGLTRSQAEARLRELIQASHEEAKAATSTGRRESHGHTVAELGALYIEYAGRHRRLKATTLADYLPRK